MLQIGILSDTHSYLNEQILNFFSTCDEIWHAGDIGDIAVINSLSGLKETRAVYGNIDNYLIRKEFPQYQYFSCEDMNILMMHIGGYPGKYSSEAKELILKYKPDIFVSGHSHILKIMYDKKNSLLYINPGAAGNSGFHKVITAVKFKISEKNISDMEVLEIQRNTLSQSIG